MSATPSEVSRVPKPPKQCGVYGCGRETEIVFMVIEEYGRTRCGSPHDFANENERNHALTMRGDYEFVRWITRCANCYQHDIELAHKDRDGYLRNLPEPPA